MCVRFRPKDRSCWKELDDNLLHFQQNHSKKISDFRIRNISADLIVKYPTISSTSVGVLNKQKSYLNIFIETINSTIIGRLDKNTLELKITYRIFQQWLFYSGPIYDFNNNILLILQYRRIVQLSRNKLIRKYKGQPEQYLNNTILTRMGLRSFNLIRKENYFLIDQVQSNFERIFNIWLFEIDQKYGTHIFKKLGNFIILTKQYKFREQHLTHDVLPVYYLSIDVISKGDGLKGKICMNKDETLKIIKYHNNSLYVVIKQNDYFLFYEIKSDSERKLIYQLYKARHLKKPIFQQDRLIVTNIHDYSAPKEYKVDYDKCQQAE